MMFAMPVRANGRSIKRIAFRRVLLCCPLGLFGQQFDLLIRNGRVIDGSGTPGISADIGVTGDRIAFLGQAPSGAKAARVIDAQGLDRKSTRLNSSHQIISYAVFCLKKKKKTRTKR